MYQGAGKKLGLWKQVTETNGKGKNVREQDAQDETLRAVTVWYMYDGNQIIEEVGPNGNLWGEWVYGLGIDEPLLMKRGGQESYYHMNHLGSVTHITDKQGDVVEQYSHDVYGYATILNAKYEPQTGSAVGNIYYFTGRQLDFETGIYYYRARYYDAIVGRFLQRDPAEDDVLLNLYAYVKNNPVRTRDPYGKWGQDVHYGNDKVVATPAKIAGVFFIPLPIFNRALPKEVKYQPSQVDFSKKQDGSDVTIYGTLKWLHEDKKMIYGVAEGIAYYCMKVDSGWRHPWHPFISTKFHFDRKIWKRVLNYFRRKRKQELIKDTREYYADKYIEEAVSLAKRGHCRAIRTATLTLSKRNLKQVLKKLGTGLHIAQDRFSHSDRIRDNNGKIIPVRGHGFRFRADTALLHSVVSILTLKNYPDKVKKRKIALFDTRDYTWAYIQAFKEKLQADDEDAASYFFE